MTGRGRALADCTQADVDAWHAELFATRRPAQVFLRWSVGTARMPKLVLPTRYTYNPAPITQDSRLGLIRQLLTDHGTPLRERVAGLVLLLYGVLVRNVSPAAIC